jgi:hypothetical protein
MIVKHSLRLPLGYTLLDNLTYSSEKLTRRTRSSQRHDDHQQ